MKNIVLMVLAFSIAIIVTGCSLKGHKYTADMNTVHKVQEFNLKKVFVANNSNSTQFLTIRLRGATMTSPYENSFNTYLKKALKAQLQQSDLFDKNSEIIIMTDLLRHDIDSWGFSIGTADISAKFIVKIKGRMVYSKIHDIHHTWPSSFIGQIAIENAIDNYPIAIQKVINKFILDKDFIKLISK